MTTRDQMVTVTIRMPADLKRRLVVAADARVVSASLLARKAIEHYLDTVPDAIYYLRTTATYTPPTAWERFKTWWQDAWPQ